MDEDDNAALCASEESRRYARGINNDINSAHCRMQPSTSLDPFFVILARCFPVAQSSLPLSNSDPIL